MSKLPSIEELLEAGVHFGHQTSRWNPKMKSFLLTEKNGIHIIDLRKTLVALEAAGKIFKKVLSEGQNVIFIGTKVTTRTVLQEASKKCGQYYVTKRWLGGMLTNFQTVKKSIKQLEKIEKMEKDGVFNEMQKKEVLKINLKKDRLEEVFGGIRHMKGLPSLAFVTDVKHQHIAVAELKKLGIPIVALCDSNIDPETVDYPIPANDDAVKSVQIIVNYLVDQAASAANPKKAAEAGPEKSEESELETKGA